MKQHKNTCFSSCLQSSFFKTNREFLHFSFKTAENFSNSKPWPQGKESWVKTWPPGSENMQIPGGSPGGDGQAWNYNWLIHYLVLTIWVHFLLSVHIFATINLHLWVLVKLENKRLSSTAVCTTFTSKKCYLRSSWFNIYCCSVPRANKLWNWAKVVVLSEMSAG